MLKVRTGFATFVAVPLRLTVATLAVDELLETVIVPLAAPATVGTKLT